MLLLWGKKHIYDETVPERMRNVRFVILKAISLRFAEVRNRYGFPYFVFSSRDFNLLGSHYELTDTNFVSFGGYPNKPIGVSDAQVAKWHKTFTGSMFICPHGPNILGRDWFTQVFDQNSIDLNHINAIDNLDYILKKY
ncbi:hypothetical protein HZS_7169 [Henneguya salminicola]|nr:hypothetical protein HZS_7169 [Henneguya salminicola]